MISESFADHIRSQINDDTAKKDSLDLDSAAHDDYGTSHLSVIAEDGSAVAVTSSINEQ